MLLTNPVCFEIRRHAVTAVQGMAQFFIAAAPRVLPPSIRLFTWS